MAFVQFIENNWAVIATLLFVLSELLAHIPSVQANSIFQLIMSFLKKEKESADTKASK